jgi:hypothetical protein
MALRKDLVARGGAGVDVGGVPLRVVELTGEPGDMVFCHPLMVHCSTQNLGTRPRFMRIKQQLLTPEGRQLLRTLIHPRW